MLYASQPQRGSANVTEKYKVIIFYIPFIDFLSIQLLKAMQPKQPKEEYDVIANNGARVRAKAERYLPFQ